MNQFDIILVRGTEFVSKTIEEITNSQYSHTTIYMGDNSLIEAEGFEKTGYVPLNKYDGIYDVYRYENLTDVQGQAIKDYLVKQVGSHYDYLLLLQELIRYLFHISLPFKEPYNSHVCSTLVNDAFKSASIELCPNIKYPSPADICNSKLLRKVE